LAAIKLAATTGINQLHAKSGVVDQVFFSGKTPDSKNLRLPENLFCLDTRQKSSFSVSDQWFQS